MKIIDISDIVDRIDTMIKKYTRDYNMELKFYEIKSIHKKYVDDLISLRFDLFKKKVLL